MKAHEKLRKLVPQHHRIYEIFNGCGSSAGYQMRCPKSKESHYNGSEDRLCKSCKMLDMPVTIVEKEEDL